MQIKTFTGSGTQEVLAQIKADLGPDAVILGSREVRKDGQRLFEITAGIERNTSGPSGAGTTGGSPEGWDAWHEDWTRMKEHLYGLMQPAIQWTKLNPRQRVALEYLQREGVDSDVVVELYQALLQADTNTSMLSALAAFVPVKPWGKEHWPQKVHMLCGPFGSGKTTVALRLGMQLRLEYPDISIAYINADCARGNGRLVLRHWAELSDFRYYESPNAQSMKNALKATQDANIVFIDLPGLSRTKQKIDNLKNQLENLELLPALPNMALHLVLAPHYAPRQLENLLRMYKAPLPTSLVWTKLDEASHYGALVNIAVRHKLPISALSFGPDLQSSLVPAQEGAVWRLLLKRQLPSPAKDAAA